LNRPTKPLGQTEFIALMAMLAATTAFSIDAMLPALPQIAAELSPANPNAAQLIITSFVAGQTLTFPLWVYGAVKTGIPQQVFVLSTLIFLGGALIAVLNSVLAHRAGRRAAA
jgi:DHA1 family bicyclomycin/chloramphenicol resistance-like MFS transporter